MTPESLHRLSDHDNRRRWPQWILHAVFGSIGTAGFLFTVLVILWLGQSSRSIFQRGAEAVTIRAVLRTDVDINMAQDLAQRLRGWTPDAKIEIISERMGRSLLALQEPWITQMPDFEVTPLPILLEVHHPQLLTNPSAVAKFVEELGQEPEVDFVAFNETAHTRLVKLASSALTLQQHMITPLVWALAIAALITAVLLLHYSVTRTIPYTFALAALTWGCGWGLAWPIFRVWESEAIKLENWERLSAASISRTAWISALIFLLAAGITTATRWVRR